MSGEVLRWELLADMVKATREALGMTSQSQLAEAAGVAVGTVQRLEGGKPYPRLPNRTPAIERALDWPPGTARKIVEGEIDSLTISPRTADAEESARAALHFARSLLPEDEQAYRDALAAAKSLSRAEKKRLLAELFDDAEPAVKSGERAGDA